MNFLVPLGAHATLVHFELVAGIGASDSLRVPLTFVALALELRGVR